MNIDECFSLHRDVKEIREFQSLLKSSIDSLHNKKYAHCLNELTKIQSSLKRFELKKLQSLSNEL